MNDLITIGVGGGKGGVGKTSLLTRIANKLALTKKVLIIDMDALANAKYVYNLDGVYQANDILTSINTRAKGLLKAGALPLDGKKNNLWLWQWPNNINQDDFELEVLETLIRQAKEQGYEYVLLDIPAGLDAGFIHSAMVADQIVYVVNPANTSASDANMAISKVDIISTNLPDEDGKLGLLHNGTYYHRNTPVDKYILYNRVESERLDDEDYMRVLYNTDSSLGVTPLGVVPYDSSVIGDTNHGKLRSCMVGNSPVGDAVVRIVDRLLNNSSNISLDDMFENIRPPKNRLKRFLRIG